MKRKFLLTLVLALLLTALPFGVQAVETVSKSSPAEVKITEAKQAKTLNADSYVTAEEAGVQLRSLLKSRTANVELYVADENWSYEMILEEIFAVATAHTGNPTEGDYLLGHVAGWGGEVYQEELGNNVCGHNFFLTFEYLTTADQEAELDTAVKKLLNDLGVSSMTDYRKVKAVYDYIIQNITYDNANPEDDTYLLKYSAYSALMNKTALSDGYSTLLYRLLLEMGIDCRVIAGETDDGPHTWNICKLGSVYYNLDATKDADTGSYTYFLKSSVDFNDHYRYIEYATTEFHTEYPMAYSNFAEGVEGEPEHIYAVGVCGDNAYFSVDRDKVLTIWGTGATYDGSADMIPNGDPAWDYWYETGFTKVLIDEGITHLGINYFFRTFVDEVSLPSTLEGIGDQAFYETSLTYVIFPENLTRIGERAFSGSIHLSEIYFTGDAPEIGLDAFKDITATVYYPDDNDTWTAEVMQQYGGTLTWVSTHVHDFTDVEPVYDAATGTHTWDCLTCDVNVTESCNFEYGQLTSSGSVTTPGVMTYTCSGCGGSYETYFYLRLAGSNRYETGIEAAYQLMFELGVEQFENIVVASGTGFADALAGSYLAVVKNAPILLVNKHTTETVADYIETNLAPGGTVYLLGGEAAVPAAMEDLLDSLTVKRLAGSNRYATNLKILIEAGYAGEEILVCTGNGFADSLSASAVGKPILLVNKNLNADQLEFLESTSGEFIIIGGESAVSTAVENKLGEYGEVTRLAGANRYETSVLVAKRFFEAPTSAVLAYSQNFPDGLCGGPLAAATNSPLLLMATGRGANVIEYAQEVGISCGAVLGGTSLIDDATAKNVFSMK